MKNRSKHQLAFAQWLYSFVVFGVLVVLTRSAYGKSTPKGANGDYQKQRLPKFCLFKLKKGAKHFVPAIMEQSRGDKPPSETCQQAIDR